MSRKWLYGDKKAGYTLRKLKRKKDPWQSQIWFEGRIYRTDEHKTKKDAERYIRQRRKKFGGSKVYPKRKGRKK